MRVLTYAEARAFLACYPKVLAALDAGGKDHALSMLGIAGAKREQLMRGEIEDSEDVEPLGPLALGERGPDTPEDYYKLRAAACVYTNAASA